MWAYDSDGSLWVHMDVVICVLPEINNNFVTTIPTPEGYVLITASPSINGISCLVSMNDRVSQTRYIYSDIFRPYIYIRQGDMLHISAVGVF